MPSRRAGLWAIPRQLLARKRIRILAFIYFGRTVFIRSTPGSDIREGSRRKNGRKALIRQGFPFVGYVFPVGSGGPSGGGMPKVISPCGWGECWEVERGGSSGDLKQPGVPSGAGSMAYGHPDGASGGEHQPANRHRQRQKPERCIKDDLSNTFLFAAPGHPVVRSDLGMSNSMHSPFMDRAVRNRCKAAAADPTYLGNHRNRLLHRDNSADGRHWNCRACPPPCVVRLCQFDAFALHGPGGPEPVQSGRS